METDTNDNDIMSSLKKPLFGARQSKDVSPNDVTIDTPVKQLRVITVPMWYAVTINPQPTKRLNKREYRKYTDTQQIGILTRMEAKFRRDNPCVELVELHFEKCPTLGQVHFHAKYSMPAIYVTSMEEYWRRVLDATDANTKKPWKYLDIQTVYNDQGWLDYIRKESPTGYKSKPKNKLFI